jgi:uncharacterized repeat protein (TIGR01451 family)
MTMDWKTIFSLSFCLLINPIVQAADSRPQRPDRGEAAGIKGEKIIRLKSGEFQPQGDFDPNFELVKGRFANRAVVHVILQFEEIPDLAQRKQLEARGVRLLGYLPDHAFFASVPVKVKASELKVYRVRWLGGVYKEDKIAPRIRNEGLGGWALRSNATVDLQLTCFDDSDLGNLAAAITVAGGQVLSTMPELHRLTVNVPTAVLDQLAELDDVRWIEEVAPPPKVLNDGSRLNTQADIVQASPYNLSGTGVTLGIWDGGSVDSAHDDFAGRLTLGESSSVDEHATHVAGTMAGSGALSSARGGTPFQWRGVAPSADIVSYDFYGNVVAEHNNPITTRGIVLSQNSWGYVVDSFFGNCSLYGDYASLAPDFDALITGLYGRGISVVFAAGNSRDSLDCGLNNGPPTYTNYRCIAPPGTGKNIITVGAINSDDSTITDFSSWGPVDDGRIKPDLVAPGCEAGGEGFIKSALPGDTYGGNYWCGTSMAAPAVSGTIALMVEDFRAFYGTNPLPSTVKAILLHTAADLDDGSSWYNKGPDYASGYGKLQAQDAIDQIRSSGFLVGDVANGQTNTYIFNLPSGVNDVKLTLVWDDPVAQPNASVTLVNDLDLVVHDPLNARRYPWTLDPVNPSNTAVQTQEDHINPVEQVYADAGVQPGAWRVSVVGRTVPAGRQSFTLVYSIPRAVVAPAGLAIADETCGSPNSAVDPYEVVSVDFIFRNVGAIPTGDITATLLSSANVLIPSGPQSLGVLAASGGTATNRFTFKAAGDCGSVIPIEFQLTDGTNEIGIVPYIIQLGIARTNLTENFDTAAPGNLPQGWTASVTGNATAWTTAVGGADGSSNAAFCSAPAVASENRLLSPVMLVTDTEAILSFRHSFVMETCCDRGRLLISIDGGAFIDILVSGGSFTAGGYNGSGWSGNSRGFLTTAVRLPAAAAGKSVQFEWRLNTDTKTGGTGWYVDSILLQDGFDCCRPEGLSVSVLDVPNPVIIDSNLTYTVTIFNSSSAPATGVGLTHQIAASLSILAIEPSQGSCTPSGNTISCNIGTIAAGQNAIVVVRTRANIEGLATSVATVQGNEPDAEPLNDSATTVTQVRTAGVPDLIATLLEGPGVGSTGGSIMITNEVRNVGFSNAVLTFRIAFYLSDDPVFTTNDIFIGSRSIFGLGTNETSLGFTPANIPLDVDPGVYYLGAIVDFNGEIIELNEANNQFVAGNIQVIIGPDMIVASVAGPAVGSLGGTIQVSSLIENIGTGNPGNFAVGYYLSTDSVVTTNDARVAQQAISSLAPGQTGTSTVTVAISSALTPGFYYLGAIADFNESIVEANDANNAHVGGIIEIKLGLDLAVTRVTGPTNGATGNPISITNVVRNVGSNNAATFNVGFYLSTDSVIATNDQRLGMRTVSSLGVLQSVTNVLTVNVPHTNRPGVYYLGSIADYPNALPEVTETNNALRASNTINIVIGPDMTMTLLKGPSIASPSGVMQVTNTVSNAGVAPPPAFTVGFYLSADPIITTADIRIGTRSVTTLLPGTNSTSVVSMTLSATITNGTYYLGAIADYANGVQESNETNNTIVVGTPIQVANGFDLTVAQVKGPTNTYTGATLLLTNIAHNIGVDNAPNFTLGLYLSLDPFITTNDQRIGTRTVTGPLGGGMRNTNATSASIPVTNAPGQYYFGAIADYNGVLPEPNETNNWVAGNPVNIAIGPDLSASSVVGPNVAHQSSKFNVTTVVRNVGFGNSGPFSVGIYISPDPIITTGDTMVGFRNLSSLVPGASSTGVTQVAIGGAFASGTYYWGMIADHAGVVPEITETNNARAGNTVTIQPGVDLIMTTMAGPEAWCTGNPFVVTNIVRNVGIATAYQFSVGLYLSDDPEITTDDLLMAVRNVGSLGVGQSSTHLMTLVNIGGLSGGPYYFGAIADPGDGITEASEENNAVTGNPTEVTVGPDIVLRDIITPAFGSPGSSIPVTSIIENPGCGNAPIGFSIGVYLSTDPIITTADTRLGSRTLPSLGYGLMNTGTTTVALSPSLASGTYYVGVIADYVNTIFESSETNNTLLGTPVIIRPAADLVVGLLAGPTNACTGKSISVSNVVMNIGTDSASATSVGIYLSTDTNVTTADFRLGARAIAVLAPGQTNSAVTSFNLPLTLAPGVYYLGAIADHVNQLQESDELNNLLIAHLIEIAIGPELLMGEVTSTSAASPGGTINITNTVRNIGCGDATVFNTGLYLSSDPLITTADLRIGTRNVPGLVGGTINTGVTAVVLGTSLSNGVYYLGAIADYANAILEATETNNWLSTMTIEIRPGIDLAVASLAGPESAVTGTTISVTNIVQNLGVDDAPASAFGVYLSQDPIIATTDTRIGAPSIAAIPAGRSITNVLTIFVPNSISAGSYYLGGIADYANTLPETDNTNNALAGNIITISAGADLIVAAVTGPTNVNLDATFSVTTSVQNIGPGDSGTNSRVGVYLSTDAIITTNDTLLGFRNINSILAGATNTASGNVSLPGAVTAGSYYLGAVVDYQARVNEISEDNNAAVGYQIHVGVTPFRITEIRIDGTDVLITFETQTGKNFALQEASSIGGTISWSPVAGASSIAGTGSTITFRHVGAAATAPRFYRIHQL